MERPDAKIVSKVDYQEERRSHGVVQRTDLSEALLLDADAPPSRMVTAKGHNCALDGGGQSLFRNTSTGDVALERGGVVLGVKHKASIGIMTDGRSAQIGAVLTAANPASSRAPQGLSSFAGDELNQFPPNSPQAVAHMGEVMQALGIRCHDSKGNPSVPTLTPNEATSLVRKSLEGR